MIVLFLVFALSAFTYMLHYCNFRDGVGGKKHYDKAHLSKIEDISPCGTIIRTCYQINYPVTRWIWKRTDYMAEYSTEQEASDAFKSITANTLYTETPLKDPCKQ